VFVGEEVNDKSVVNL